MASKLLKLLLLPQLLLRLLPHRLLLLLLKLLQLPLQLLLLLQSNTPHSAIKKPTQVGFFIACDFRSGQFAPVQPFFLRRHPDPSGFAIQRRAQRFDRQFDRIVLAA